ncbi:MAG: hypothetical protein GWP91_25985 [Rhodobacterales bacterium]|nr:hypothetical protein [Rhodobacterales bacterium]
MHEVSHTTTLLFAGLLTCMVLTLALEEKIHAKKSLITGVYAVIALLAGAAFGVLPFGEVQLPNGHHVAMPVFIPAVDWGVITIILGASLFVDAVSQSGIFTWAAIKLTKASGGDPFRLLVAYSGLTVVFSAVLNNVTAMIIVGSLSAVSLNKLNKKELLLGFLLIEGLLTNVGGLLTLISSVPNIILGNLADIPFMTFFYVAAPYVCFTTVVTLMMGVKLFGISPLKDAEARVEAEKLVQSFNENDGIGNQLFFNVSWLLLGLFCAVMAGASQLPWVSSLGLGFVAMSFAIMAMIPTKNQVDKNWAAFDWDLLFFFVFLFVVINVAEHALVLDLIGDGLSGLIELGDVLGGGLLLWAAAIASSVTDNVPLAAVLGKIIAARPDISPDSHLWWCCIFGANLGGNFSPIGSASTVVAVAVMHKHGLPISFVGFVRKALPFALVHVTLATAYVLLFLV